MIPTGQPKTFRQRRRRLLGRFGRVFKVFTAIIIVCVVLVTSQVLAWEWLSAHNGLSRQDLINNYPGPYKDSAYWSPAFMKEMGDAVSAWYWDDRGFWIAGAFRGKWISLQDGFRTTESQPSHAKHTIYIFGNSAAYGFSVPDDGTIASKLQALFNQNFGDDYKVVNVGSIATMISNEYARLQTISLQPNDIVVFYDGLQDVADIYDSAERRYMAQGGGFCGWLSRTLPMPSTDIICWNFKHSAPPGAVDRAAIQDMAAKYRTVILEANQFSLSKGARFYHVIQPIIWSRPLSPTEAEVIELQEPKDVALTYYAGWPELQKVAASTIANGVESYDLTHILDSYRQQGREFFLDRGHTNEYANAIVARSIYDILTLI